VNVGVVVDRQLAEEKEVVETADHVREDDRAEAGDDADRQ